MSGLQQLISRNKTPYSLEIMRREATYEVEGQPGLLGVQHSALFCPRGTAAEDRVKINRVKSILPISTPAVVSFIRVPKAQFSLTISVSEGKLDQRSTGTND